MKEIGKYTGIQWTSFSKIVNTRGGKYIETQNLVLLPRGGSDEGNR